MPIATRSSARQTRSTACDSIYDCDSWNYRSQKNHLEVKICTRAWEATSAAKSSGGGCSGASKTRMAEPIAEEDFADVSNDSNAKAAHVPVEDPSSNDSIPTMNAPCRSRTTKRVPMPPPDAALNDLANDPFNLSGRVASRSRVQGSWDTRTQQQRVEDNEEGHADDERLEGLEVEGQEHDGHADEERFEVGWAGGRLRGYVCHGYDDNIIDFEELRTFAPRDPPCRHSASPRRGSSAKSLHRRRHSIDSPTRRTIPFSTPRRPHAGSPASDDHPSQKAVLESELSHSSDDYGDEQAQKARVKNRRVVQGERVSPSIEDEDEEDEREFEKEVERNGFDDERGAGELVSPSTEDEDEEDEREYEMGVGRVGRQVEESNTAEKGEKRKSKKSADVVDGESGAVGAAGGASKPRRKRKAKGKAKMVDSGRDSDCVVGEDEEDDGGNLKAGAISGAVKDRLYELYDEFTTAVDELARSCGKSSLTLHQMVGTVIKTPHGLNAWNVWQRYFAETTPKEQKLQGRDYAKQAHTAFIAACRVGDDFPEEKLKDSDAVFERLPWLLEWNKKLTQQAVIAVRENGKLKPKLRREIKPVTQIAKQMLDTYGVHVWGYVIDPEGQGSFVFGAGDDFKEMRALQLHNLNQQVKDQEHTFGMIEMRKRGLAAHSIPIQNLNPHEHEGPCDVFRRQFTSIIGGQLWAFCHAAGTLSGQDVDRAKFQMKWNTKFIDVARESKCRIVNYPAALQAANQIIGTQQFNVKKIKSATFERFMSSLVKANETRNANDDGDDVMQIVAWEQDEIDLPLDEQGDVAVVVDEHGVGLVTVKQSEGYAKEVKKQAEKAEKAEKRKRKKERGTGAQQQDEEGGYARPPMSRRKDDGDYYREDSHRPHQRAQSRSPPRAESPRNYRASADSRSRSPPAPSHGATTARSSRHNRPHADSRSRSPLRAESSRHNRPRANPRFRSPPRAGVSHHYPPARQLTLAFPCPRRVIPPVRGHEPRRLLLACELAAPCQITIARSTTGQVPVPARRALALARQRDGETPLPRPDGRAESSWAPSTVPPRLDLSRMDAVAARVGAARRDHRAQGPDEKRGPKRKAPHDEELLDRDHKRHRGTEEALPLLKCRIINVDRPIRADGVFYVHNPERRVWKQIGPNVAPVLATEDDRKQYAKELEDFGL
ncbi:hypothetical protein B0H14DRAFT_3662711 [Mycena olivaceomarginata]|nr:hypothetical protein B0H14DRAFT_3662711 [Mycena olivaceomarginata]